jgi:hypothetical protein
MKLKVSIFSIATNIYFDYWLKMYESANKNLFPDAEVTFHVFSNIEPTPQQRLSMKENIKFNQIEDLRWPAATLKRYELIVNHMHSEDAEVIAYLDADMLINEIVNLRSIYRSDTDGMVLVRHPGYWRPAFNDDKSFYFRHLDIAVKDILMWIRMGGIGAWERNKKSKAFVTRSKRNNYYCGGFWLGEKKAVLNFARSMYQNVEMDENNNVMAIWHDESHLNYWAATNNFSVAGPSYCFSEGYKNLERVPQIITAVSKAISTR